MSTRSSGGSQDSVDGQVLAGWSCGTPTLGQPAGQPMCGNGIGAEPGGDPLGRQCGERGDSGGCPSRISRSTDRCRSGGAITRSRANSVIGNGAQNAAEPPLGDQRRLPCAASTATSSTSAMPTRALDVQRLHRVDDLFGGGFLCAEVAAGPLAAQATIPGRSTSTPGAISSTAGGDRLEHPAVPVGVDLVHQQFRAARLRVPATHGRSECPPRGPPPCRPGRGWRGTPQRRRDVG